MPAALPGLHLPGRNSGSHHPSRSLAEIHFRLGSAAGAACKKASSCNKSLMPFSFRVGACFRTGGRVQQVRILGQGRPLNLAGQGCHRDHLTLSMRTPSDPF